MTVKEIAELCGVDETTVLRWIGKMVDGSVLNCKMQLRNSIKEKLDKGSPEHPSDYDLEETLAIIRDGGKNRTLAALLAENAENKNAVANYTGNSRIEALFTVLEGFRADFQKFLENTPKALPDPQETANRELENFVEKTLEVDPGRIYRVYVEELYHAYEKEAQNPLGKQEFMYRIALNHPEFELACSKKAWYFTRCELIRII